MAVTDNSRGVQARHDACLRDGRPVEKPELERRGHAARRLFSGRLPSVLVYQQPMWSEGRADSGGVFHTGPTFGSGSPRTGGLECILGRPSNLVDRRGSRWQFFALDSRQRCLVSSEYVRLGKGESQRLGTGGRRGRQFWPGGEAGYSLSPRPSIASEALRVAAQNALCFVAQS